MVLRSGCIIPFQFRDHKKLLMIGVPEENRNLSIWDLKNVVRAAFGVYNFEFRNKKIGFSIPDELLLNYLAQRHDLTNFIIEVGQLKSESMRNDDENFEPSCSQQLNIPVLQKSNDYATNEDSEKYVIVNEALKSPLKTNNYHDSPKEIRITRAYSAHIPKSSIQPIDVMDKIQISECNEHEMDFDVKQDITSEAYTQPNLPLLIQSPPLQHSKPQQLSKQSNPIYSKNGTIKEKLNFKLSPATGIITARRLKTFKRLGKVNNKSTHQSRRSINTHNKLTEKTEKCARKKRHSRWSLEEEQKLLELWEKKLPELRGNKRNSHVYVTIADVMCRNDFDFNAAEIRYKIKNLTTRYREEKKSKTPSDWPHFEQVKMLLDSYKNYNIETMVEETIDCSSSSE